MHTRPLAACVLVALLSCTAVPAAAQTGTAGPVFRVETDAVTATTRPGFVTGWLYNDGRGVAGLIRMRVEMVDGSGKVAGEHFGWAYGNVAPGGRAYFRIPVSPSPHERRVSVESFVMQALDAP